MTVDSDAVALDNPVSQSTMESNSTGSVQPKLFIREYRVDGTSKLPRIAIEEAVYPFLGPGRTRDDVERARAALEKAYFDKGLQTVAVLIPEQTGQGGIIHLQVVERTVGRLRVKGAKYSSPNQIKALAPSLAEGGVINFEKVTPDIVALNQLPGRTVTPSLRGGATPDTVDVDLEVKERSPVHGSVELNNRQSPETEPLRVNASVTANNLWQAGHTLGFSFQVAPQDTSQVKVFSGYYLGHFSTVDWLSLLVQATKSDSNVASLGDVAVAGRGETAGFRFLFALPAGKEFSHSASVGIDYKNYQDDVSLPASGSTPASVLHTPIRYYPLEANYSATWAGKGATTEASATAAFNFRGAGGKSDQFGNSRFHADANYVILRAELSHTHDLPAGFQIYGKAQGQLADQPLISHEQASGGGLGTVRGYLEAEVVGDDALFGSVELRSPSLLRAKTGEWRVYTFFESGKLTLIDTLAEQKDHFYLASYGVGSHLRLLNHFDGSINATIPIYSQSHTKANDLRVTFRAGMDF